MNKKLIMLLLLSLVCFSILTNTTFAKKGGIPSSPNGKGNPHPVPNDKKNKNIPITPVYVTIENVVIETIEIETIEIETVIIETIEVNETAITSLEEEISVLETQITILQNQVNDLENQVDKLEIQLYIIESTDNYLEEEIEDVRQAINTNNIITIISLILSVLAFIIAFIAISDQYWETEEEEVEVPVKPPTPE